MKNKILIISNFFPPNIVGGYEIACMDTVEILSAYYDVYVLTSNFRLKSGAYPTYVLPKLICFKNFGYFDEVYEQNQVELHNSLVLKEVISTLNPDLVYVWNFNGLGFNFLNELMINHIPVIYHFMDESILTYAFSIKKYINYLLGRYTEKPRRLSLNGEGAIFISNYLRNKMNSQVSSIREHVVIYPYLDINKIPFKKSYSVGEIVECVYVGQVEKHKGIDLLCELIYQFNLENKSKIKLTIYGKSGSGLDLELLNKYNDFIVIESDKKRSDILDSLHRFDFGFFPSVWEEPFGIAQIELMAAGLPVITTLRGGSSEAVDPACVLKLDFNKFNEIMESALKNESTRSSIGKLAREKVIKNFNMEIYSQKIVEFIERKVEIPR